MYQESIITIQEALSDDFYAMAMAQVQTDGIQRILEEFEEDQRQLTLELEEGLWEGEKGKGSRANEGATMRVDKC